MLGDDGAGSDDATFADVAVVEDASAHADHAMVFNHAAVDSAIVADCDPVADDDGVEVALAVEDRTVLDVGTGPDADGIHVTAQDGVHPNGGAFAEHDVTENLGGYIDVATGWNRWDQTLIGANHRARASGAIKPTGRL